MEEKFKRFEIERMALNEKNLGCREQINALEKTIEVKNHQIKKLHDGICQLELRLESLRDPTGLQ